MMIDLGKHAAFIWASYACVLIVLSALVVWLLTSGRQLQRRLDELESEGVKRRSGE